MRRREDKALEVWLKGQPRPVGWLTAFKDFRLSMIQVDQFRVGSDGEIVDDSRIFTLSVRTAKFTNFDIIKNGKEWLLQQLEKLPAYAVELRNANEDSTSYIWKVLMVDQDEYEWLFDRDDFEPLDSEPDMEQLCESQALSRDEQLAQELRQRMDAAIKRTILGDSDPFSSFGSATTNTNLSPNSSALTLDSLKKSLALISSNGK